MSDNTPDQPPVDQLLQAFHDGELDQMALLGQLMDQDLWVILDTPWDGGSALPPGTRLLLVNEDEDLKMLALFSSRKLARLFMRDARGYEHLAPIPGALAMLAVTTEQGAVINPNQANGCRIPPPVAAYLKRSIQRQLAGQA